MGIGGIPIPVWKKIWIGIGGIPYQFDKNLNRDRGISYSDLNTRVSPILAWQILTFSGVTNSHVSPEYKQKHHTFAVIHFKRMLCLATNFCLLTFWTFWTMADADPEQEKRKKHIYHDYPSILFSGSLRHGSGWLNPPPPPRVNRALGKIISKWRQRWRTLWHIEVSETLSLSYILRLVCVRGLESLGKNM